MSTFTTTQVSMRSFVRYLLLVFCVVAALKPLSPAQALPSHHSTVTKAQFNRAVAQGIALRGRRIPSSFIIDAIRISSSLQRNGRTPTLRLDDCIIDGPVIKFSDVSHDELKSEDIRRHFELRNVVPLKQSLELQWSHCSVETGVYFNDLLLAAPMSFQDVDFVASLYLQGAAVTKPVTFNAAHFKALADFSGMLITAPLAFQDCEFSKLAAFSESEITKEGKIYLSGERITTPIDFSSSSLSGVITLEGETSPFQLLQPLFLNDINVGQTPRGYIHLKNVLLSTVYADKASLEEFDFSELQGGLHRPIRFTGFGDFRQSTFSALDLAGAEFTDSADFTGASFLRYANFERAKFQKPVLLRWYQLNGKLHSSSGEALSKEGHEELERNFHALDDLESENECKYEKRLHADGHNWEWWLLGFEVRRRIPFFWVLTASLAFLGINLCLTRKKSIKRVATAERREGPNILDSVIILKEAAITLKLPKEYKANAIGRRWFFVEASVLKLLIGCYLIAIAHTSPLLKDLLPYLGVK